MKEGLWALLLLLPLWNGETRPLAWLLAVKFSLIYALYLPFPAAPAVLDLAFAPLVFWCVRISRSAKWALWFGSLYTAILFAHGVHWTLWSEGVYVGVQYYYVMLWLFTGLIITLYGSGGIVESIRSISGALLPQRRVRSIMGARQAGRTHRPAIRSGEGGNRRPDGRECGRVHLSTEES